MSLEVGNRIGDYEIVSVLGAGGMGKVYKVRNVISDRVEALKILLPNLEHEPELADRFMREIKVQASLQHPNIAALHTALRVENQLLMVMELVDGVTLEQQLKAGPIPIANAVNYISQVLFALGYAHQHGVVHRDIKPANMMVTADGTVKLMDFGIAKAAADRKLTMTGTTMGSLYYMSPEQIKGMSNLDARSDLYSVGVSLYEIVTGKKPFDGDSQFAIMAAHLEKTPVPPITYDAALPPILNDVILMSITKDPEKRFQSAQAFAGALSNVAKSIGAPVAVPTVAPIPVDSGATRVLAPTGPMANASDATAVLPATKSKAPSVTPQATPVTTPAGPVATPAAPFITADQGAKPPSRRWLWVSAGAVAMVAVLIATIQFGPWKKTSASTGAPTTQVSAPSTAPQTTPALPAAAPTSAPAHGSTAAQQTSQVPAQIPPSRPPVRQTAQAGGPASRQAQAIAQQRPPGQGASQSSTQSSTQSVSGAPAQTQRTAVTPAAAPSQAAPPSSPPGADPAALQELREHLVMLATRADAVRNSLTSLKRSQAASGMSLRGDMVTAESRMNYTLDGANSALGAHDAAAAKKFMDQAETQIEKLEKFLNL